MGKSLHSAGKGLHFPMFIYNTKTEGSTTISIYNFNLQKKETAPIETTWYLSYILPQVKMFE